MIELVLTTAPNLRNCVYIIPPVIEPFQLKNQLNIGPVYQFKSSFN